jgi:hypothetical protein
MLQQFGAQDLGGAHVQRRVPGLGRAWSGFRDGSTQQLCQLRASLGVHQSQYFVTVFQDGVAPRQSDLAVADDA